ncbi:hypothetical protein Tco_0813309 [Tanacetum coccineum]
MRKFLFSNEETIDSGFTRSNVIVTSLKSLHQYYSNKNHVRKFLQALLLKWRPKVTKIEEEKDLAEFPLDEILKLKSLGIYEMFSINDGVVSKNIKENVKSLALKAKVTRDQTSDDSDSQDGSEEDDEDFNLMAWNFRKFFRKGNRDKNHFISDTPHPKENKAFVGGAWSDSEDGDQLKNDATCLMAIDSS